MAHRLLGTSGKESFSLLKVWAIIFCNVYNALSSLFGNQLFFHQPNHHHHHHHHNNHYYHKKVVIYKYKKKTITIRRSFPFFFSSSSLWPCFRSPCCSLQKIFWTMPPCCSLQKYFLNFLDIFSAFSILPTWCALCDQCKTITQNLCLCRASETLKWSHPCPNYQALHEWRS